MDLKTFLQLFVLVVWALDGTFCVEGKLFVDFSAQRENILANSARSANSSRVFYGIMMDAGSTGTRIHVYAFIQEDPDGLPYLHNETFHSEEIGLSSYVNTPVEAGKLVRELLKVATAVVPRDMWHVTPLVLRATAGFRLLPADKAHVLIEEIKEVFSQSPFLVTSRSVSIIDGTYEGILAWVSLNFLTGHLHVDMKRSAGVLDLGGASTQITFLPKCQKTVNKAPTDHVAKLEILNTTYLLYSHSYLKNGLKVARLVTLGALSDADPGKKVFKSLCLPRNYSVNYTFGGITYEISGNINGYNGYETCYKEVLKAIKGSVRKPYNIHENVFYAVAYYYDMAKDSGLIEGSQGEHVEVKRFKKKAKEVCSDKSKDHYAKPFECMDLTYITALLTEGFGFQDSVGLQLTKKVKGFESSWALGAMLEYLHKVRIP
ncbi:ectonucleoside triphosphate diphosphohydrolase 5-like isoform X2 [Brienomyrus brachyistius]|uniref:ectonucleoside triphosphate diphosphohydrolase 5-like isoform X2 n=1 Tax=Brienomyrus brachyistius TaxID=42636 RepID=UPI0020B3B63B|nr:ectonucleoside triphosphate diphosphohydrolase 5-like isoform X2 [Brienomyrus brachyistius]